MAQGVKISADQIAAALRDNRGMISLAAAQLGVGRQAISRRVARSSKLREVVAECREGVKDLAESKLFSAVDDGEAWAVCFLLKTQAKDRGYVERTEQTGKDGSPLQMLVAERIVYVDDESPAGGSPRLESTPAAGDSIAPGPSGLLSQ